MVYYGLIIFLLLALFSKNTNILACGIWGYVGSDMPNMWRFKLLGLYNEPRGRHSCGVMVDNTIMHGVGLEKEFNQFILKRDIPDPVQESVVLGHVRHATFGAHTEANAHPFLINDRLIGVHNGTVENIRDLATKYKVDVTGIDVDSKMLYKIIEETGFEVLNDYLGYAALMFKYIDEPNVLYAYHGASKDKHDSALWIERPLHYYTERHGVWLSSEADPLKIIQEERFSETGEELKPVTFPHNKVMRIDYSKGDKPVVTAIFEANRNENNIYLNDYKNRHLNKYVAVPANIPFPQASSKNTGNGGAVSTNPVNSSANQKRTISPDELNTYAQHASFSEGRFYTQGKLLHGVFKISGFGTLKKPNDYLIDAELSTYYFVEGVMLQNHDAYQNLHHQKKILKKLQNSNKFARIISNYSKYPVRATVSEVADVTQSLWYWKGRVQPYLLFAPLFSCSKLEIFNGADNTRKSSYGSIYNKPPLTETVYTNNLNETPPADVVEVGDANLDEVELVDLSLLDFKYDDLKDVVMTLPDDVMEFIEDYILYAHFDNDDSMPRKRLVETMERMITFGCNNGDTLRQSIDAVNLSIDDYHEMMIKYVDFELEDEEDEEEEEQKLIEKTMGLMTEIEKKVEDIESEEYTPEEELKEVIGDITSNLAGLRECGKMLEKINHSHAAELSVMVNSFVQEFRFKFMKFLRDRNYMEEVNEVIEKVIPVVGRTEKVEVV